MMKAILDIETTGVKADNSQLVAIGLLIENDKKGWDEKILVVERSDQEAKILGNFANIMKNRKVNAIVTHWGTGFDVPFLTTRALINNIDLSETFNECNVMHIDLCEFAKNELLLSSNSLKNIIKVLGISKENKFEDAGDCSGAQIPQLYLKVVQGDAEAKEKLIKYLRNDLEATRLFFEKVEKYFGLEMGWTEE